MGKIAPQGKWVNKTHLENECHQILEWIKANPTHPQVPQKRQHIAHNAQLLQKMDELNLNYIEVFSYQQK